MRNKQTLAWRTLPILVVLAIALSGFGLAIPQSKSSRAIIYVPDTFPTIQGAVDAAGPGDTIIVRDGTYTENVDVNKSLTIQSENGAEATIVEAANPDDPVFDVRADYVNLSGFRVTGASEGGVDAVYLQGTESCSVSHNIFSNNWVGVFLLNSNGNAIEQNSFSSHGLDGILSQSSHYNTICENIVSDSVGGIRLGYSTFNKVVKNIASHNHYGISLDSSSDCNLVARNTASNNTVGIYRYGSNNNIYLNNFVNNTENVNPLGSANTWNSPEELIYTYSGSTYTNYLGNYWSDYTGTDADGDGIGDTPYSINGDNDNYPLTEPFENYGIIELAAETGITEEQDGSGVVVIPTTIVRVKDAVTEETVEGVSIGCYTARAIYDPAGIELLAVNAGDSPFDSTVFNIYPDYTHFTQFTTALDTEPPIVVAKLVPRLVGCATDSYNLQVTFDVIATPEGEEIPEQEPQFLTFQRGDINGNGEVDIIDGMVGAQYIVGIRPVDDIRQLNMASVRHDDGGDIKDITDCMFIAQHVVGIRDCYFELVP